LYARNLTDGTGGTPPILPLGAFFGCDPIERQAGALVLAIRDADPHRMVERHSHEDAHFVLVLGGDYRSTARDLPNAADRPLLVYNPPGTTHRDHFAMRDGIFSGRFFTLSVPRAFDAAANGIALSDDAPRALSHPLALGIAAHLERECRRWDDVSASVSESLSLELLHLAARSPNADDRRAPPWLPRVVERLHDAGAGDVSIGDLARDAGVHPVHLARAFRRWVGCTPGEMARRRRGERALAMLRATARPLSLVAAECGYADQSHLTRDVQRLAGVSPGVYRRSWRRRGVHATWVQLTMSRRRPHA
jgi:AraC family transcriptional regulator